MTVCVVCVCCSEPGPQANGKVRLNSKYQCLRTSSCMVAPGDVNPGAMMFAPDSTNLIAPLSALNFFIMSGYWCRILSVGHHGPSRSWKNRGTLLMMTICTWPSLRQPRRRCQERVEQDPCPKPTAWRPTDHFPTSRGSFLGISTSITPVSSSCGYSSQMDAAWGRAQLVGADLGAWPQELLGEFRGAVGIAGNCCTTHSGCHGQPRT